MNDDGIDGLLDVRGDEIVRLRAENRRLRERAEAAERERTQLIAAWPKLGIFAAWDVPGEGWAARSSVTGQAIAGFATHEAAVRFAAGLDDETGEADGGSR